MSIELICTCDICGRINDFNHYTVLVQEQSKHQDAYPSIELRVSVCSRECALAALSKWYIKL